MRVLGLIVAENNAGNICYNFICERDVIGKRCRFKICCRKVCGFESHRSYQPLLFVVRSGGVVVVGEKARNSIKSLDTGQGAEPMAR